MIATSIRSTFALVAAAMLLTGCQAMQQSQSTSHGHSGTTGAATMSKMAPAATHQLVAVMQPTEGFTVKGIITFTDTPAGVKVVADISGLSLNATHAMHIHEFGDLRSRDGTSAGGHYNPEGHAHGLPGQAAMRHAGDLGNLTSDYNGNCHYEITINNVTLDGKTNPIIGRGVIIHAQADDGGQPTGNAGGRIAIGVIGVAKP